MLKSNTYRSLILANAKIGKSYGSMSAPKNVEIERKFLIKSDAWRQLKVESSEDLRQGFLSTDPERTVRVRVRAGKGYLTIKGKTKVGCQRKANRFVRSKCPCLPDVAHPSTVRFAVGGKSRRIRI